MREETEMISVKKEMKSMYHDIRALTREAIRFPHKFHIFLRPEHDGFRREKPYFTSFLLGVLFGRSNVEAEVTDIPIFCEVVLAFHAEFPSIPAGGFPA